MSGRDARCHPGRVGRAAGLVLLLLAASASCAGVGRGGSAEEAPGCVMRRPPAGSDSLRGIVRVVGSGAAASIVIRGADSAAVTLVGDNESLAPLAGMEIVAFGTREPSRMRVRHVRVRALDGVPAFDGTLLRKPGVDFLVLDTGERLPILMLPPALWGANGQRIVLTGRVTPYGFGSFEPDMP